MRVFNDKITFSPTDLVRFFESEFVSYMDRFEKVISDEMCKNLGVHRNPADPLYSLITDIGKEHEENLINKIKKTNSVLHIEKNNENRDIPIKQTLSAMKKGERKIYQAAIKKDIIFGYVDLLMKAPGASYLGHYHYVPYDFKISRHPKPSALIQLCCYCDILQSIQGFLPSFFVVVTKDEYPHRFKTSAFFYFYQFLKKQFLRYHSRFSKDCIPIPDKIDKHRDWSLFARQRLHTLDDISLVAGIRSTHCVLLRRKGINKLSELSEYKTDSFSVKGIPGVTLRTLKDQAEIQAISKGKATPEFKVLSHGAGERKGLEMLPSPHFADVFFDMEGYPLLGKDGLEYLYGNIINEEQEYICFWATSEKEEVRAFKSWLDWIYQRWQKNPGMRIYHYGHYEPSTIKKLMGKYGTGEKEVDNLLRNQVFVDLHRIVTQGLRIGVFSYSLKEVEQLYYKKRTSSINTGGQAAVNFFHFLNSNNHFENSPFLEEIKTYNRDDCLSTKKLCRFLWNIQKRHNIKYIPSSSSLKEKKQENRPSDVKGHCEKKAEELLSPIPPTKRNLLLSDIKKGEEEFYIRQLLANLLKFHIREDKPEWWHYFSRLEMNAEDILEDKDTITDCRWVESAGENHKIQFEREQEISLSENDSVIILENTDDIWNTYTILSLDLIEGSLWIKSDKQSTAVKNNISKNTFFTLILKKNNFYKKNLFFSLLKTANDFSPSARFMGLKKCIYDLLWKNPPDLPDHKGPLISNQNRIVEETSSLISRLNNSVFCIQGPPGTGKTYTAAHIILKLIKKGNRVGVTANAHKAIVNILKTIFTQNKDGFCFPCQKVIDSRNSEEEQILFQHLPVELVKSNQVNKDALVVGGTAFFFSKKEQENSYDYLFVDEASQVSLTNIVATGRATKNIVLIGDQNQLDQPIQATHPGESGQSVLTYYTTGDKTISENKGVFLPLSYRMHSDICRFISGHFYNGKLKNHFTTTRQKILFSDSSLNSVNKEQKKISAISSVNKKKPSEETKEAKSAKENQKSGLNIPGISLVESGLCFVPVKHSGNAHNSIEEAKVISLIYKQLLKAEWINTEGKASALTTEDILIVAPYNVQVACLKQELNTKTARIASVDKFQGQEAPVCILSLAASTIQDAPRGISFLLNKNRLNVALSRARCLSIIVGSKNLTDTHVSSIPKMELMNIWCQISLI